MAVSTVSIEDCFGIEEESLVAASPEKISSVEVSPTLTLPTSAQLRGRTVYFDIETVPDESRMELFNLPPVPISKTEGDHDECPDIAETLSCSIEVIKSKFESFWPCDEWLDDLESAENKSAKPRAGVFAAIKSFREKKLASVEAAEERRKLLSVTPEYCRVVAFGYAIGDDAVTSLVVGDGATESGILSLFWSLAKDAKRLCGFNVLSFDLPVLFVRSVILDVAPTKLIDLRPWGGDVIDLMQARFPKTKAMRLKDLARVMGIEIPAGDVDGSRVFQLWQENPAELAGYVRSDVEITRQLHRRYDGFFCG